MRKYETGMVLTDNVSKHPAVRAWSLLRNEPCEPESVIVLKERRKGKVGKSTVYRLDGVGPSGDGVIAKRCLRASAAIERTIYEEVLPCLTVPSLDYYGSIDEQEDEFCWIFLQDAGKQAYLPHNEQHRAAAAIWLGIVHVSTQRLVAVSCLPDHGLGHYRQHLQRAREMIRRFLNKASCTASETEALKNILTHFEYLELRWRRLQSLCETMPNALVHGDFVARNICLRMNHDGIIILPFDWEMSGWGTPVVDLAQSPPGLKRFSANPDLTTYWTVVRDYWPNLQAQTLGRLGLVGTVLRLLNAIYWAAFGLSYEWVERSVRYLTIFEAGLADAVRALNSET